jgi:phosphate transport system permease protein
LILGKLALDGSGKLDWSFFTTAPSHAGRDGGIGPILVSTAIILIIAMAISLPVGLSTSALLAEQTRKDKLFGRIVRLSLDILAGVPSIVFGLFGNIFFCNIMGLGFSLLSGGLTLACMVLPILIRTTEEGFRAVPVEYGLGATALAYSRAATLWHIQLPSAMPGLLTGTILGVGRALAETAALIFTSGYVDRMPESWLDSGRTLSVHIFDLSMNVAGGDATASATSLSLVLIILTINTLLAILASRSSNRRMGR